MNNNKINAFLNGEQVEGIANETILGLAKRNGIEIPTLCHDPRLEPYSSCFLCVVEVEGARTLQTACSTKVTDGMSIYTDTDKVKQSRKAALELLLSNHYADCEAPCKQTCPANVDVQGYISLIEKGLYSEAVALIKEVNPLPAICGRVCVRPCEIACRRNLLDEGSPVGIDYMKRFAADQDLMSENHFIPEISPSTNKKIAIIGAGPGGLSAAYFLQQKGHQCDIYEAAPLGGGWLRYGIPEYRLPNDILQKEIDTITEIGVNIFYNKKLGKNLSYKEISEKYNATILTIGSQKGTKIGIKGDDAENVFSGIDFLKNMEITGKRPDFTGKKIAVLGGGNTAMDCCRTSIRCGSTDVKVIYRRTEKEMPANPIEIHESKLENVEYLFLTNPTEVNKDEDGKLKSMTCLKMKLGEPDSSGRRRPMPIPGSNFELELDFALAAIGQKTNVNFINDINDNISEGELKVNRWGDIDANPKTLQTGVDSIFAAGDGVTGAATIIEAIAQAKIASRSCHQFLMSEEIKEEKKEFISKKDNFKKQISDDYLGNYLKQLRKEMPTLATDHRLNFNEVELGYEGEEVTKKESHRCLECGCSEYFTCDLKKYSTEYEIDQKKFAGDYKEYSVDFDHPYIEIDNNKCILCSRCIRICSDIVGASALGLVDRGFETYVAPAMGNSLTETNCESCGMCISTCPTGAISENVPFKPGPVEMESFETINNYGSSGEKITVHHKNNFVMRVSGTKGLVNKDGNIDRFAKFGYHYLNDNSRITKPLLKVKKKFKEISFEEAYDIIAEKIKSVKADENSFFCGARLSNEEIYLIQKLARAGAKTNNVGSFHYLFRGKGYLRNSLANVPFEQIGDAGKVYFVGSDFNESNNAVVSYMVQKAKSSEKLSIDLVSTNQNSPMINKVDDTLFIKSYYGFVKAVNHFLLSNNLQNQMFIDDNCHNFDDYKKQIIAEDFKELVKQSGLSAKAIETFAKGYNNEMNAILIFSENEISANTSLELRNLALITGKLGKTANGLISLKENCNSQGLIDMGAFEHYGVGTQCISNEDYNSKLKEKWGEENIPEIGKSSQTELLEKGKIKNMFIFGEDPIGCAMDKNQIEKLFAKTKFVLVQDSFMTETAQIADLILPASLPSESSGSFTNTQKVIQQFESGLEPKVEKLNHQQFVDLLLKFNSNGISSFEDIMKEAISLLPTETEKEKEKFEFKSTDSDNMNKAFNYGCDGLTKYFYNNF
ncbi:MAG: molybdopterin-dependent oxidoreductase [Bacteroidetes bacterium]|jgi:formate dehydrogenase major subunit|nr:molybdopterin-dependent oxidoreductase [Bacteroidota bacterium]MBT6687304.1 molybdopterin-dependent oxidoreductase [Bacteroidota bacterium]MBT7143968.1 molybdopterin-dependent oxidoreductase [Bacteroidota bacterium]MBT7491119.1 molybdopterin-dependent oxidoreductase [Bacteroidota bacterium]